MADLPIGPIKGVSQGAAFPPLPDPSQFAGQPPVKWEPTGEYFVSDGAHWMRTVKGGAAVPQRAAYQPPTPTLPPRPTGTRQSMSRDDAIDAALGVAPRGKKYKSLNAALDAMLETPLPPPVPKPGPLEQAAEIGKAALRPIQRAGTAGGQEIIEGVKQLSPFGRGTEGPVEALSRILHGGGRLLNAPVAAAGEFLASPAMETQLGQYRPPIGTQGRALPSVADVLRSLGQAGAMVGMGLPPKPKPRIGAPTPEPPAPPRPPEQRALPPVTRGERVPPLYDAEGHLIRETFTPEGAPRRLPGQGPAGELPPHINWEKTRQGVIVPTEREGTLISERFTPAKTPKALETGIKGALPPRSYRDPRTGAIISPPGEGPVAGGISPTGRRILPSEDLAQRFGIELEQPGAPQAAPRTAEPPPKFASTQVEAPPGLASRVRLWTKKNIDQKDIHPTEGVEDKPHVTVKYGLHSDAPEEVAKIVQGAGEVPIRLGRVTAFTGHPDYDVLKVDVESPALRRLNAEIAKLPHTDTHPEYKPHLTLAYLKKGTAQKYVGSADFEGQSFVPEGVTFSPKEGKKTKLSFGSAPGRVEPTPEGMQGVIAETPKRELPKTALKPKGKQSLIEESPLYGQAKARREAELAKSQGEVGGARDPQREAVQEWLTDQLGGQGALALAQAKDWRRMPVALSRKLQDLGINPQDAWNVSHAAVPDKSAMDRLLAKAIPAKGELPSHSVPPSPTGPAPSDVQRLRDLVTQHNTQPRKKNAGQILGEVRSLRRSLDRQGYTNEQVNDILNWDERPPLPTAPEGPAPAPRKPAFVGGGFEHGVPNLDNPKDLYQIVREAGGIRTDTGVLTGELARLPKWAKNNRQGFDQTTGRPFGGQSIHNIASDLIDRFPGLGEQKEVVDKLIEGLTNYDTLKGNLKAKTQEMKKLKAHLAAKAREDPAIVELHSDVPPGDVMIDPQEWKVMSPVQRKGALDLLRDTLTDESGRLSLPDIMKTLRRIRTKFPMEEAVRQSRPDSPVIAEAERWTTGLADGISRVAETSWWKALRKMNPDELKDLEQRMFDVWDQGGRTARSYQQAIALAPQEVRDALAHRKAAFARENASRRWFGLPEVPEQMGPYLPRQVDEETLNQVTLGAGSLGRGRGPQTTVGPHAKSRTYETYRQGEQTGGLEYEDPRNSVLMREWQGVKLRATHRLFQNLEAKGALFRDQAQATAASPTGQAWKIKNAPGGEWFTPTEAEARFLQQNLSESQRGPTTSLVGYGNALLRNPNLVNPAPHVVKNMAMKALLARGPVTPYVLARDAVEYFRGQNPALIREFNEAMPFSHSGKVAGEILGAELRSGPVADAVRGALRTLGQVNRPSQKVIFEWADPAMRYSLYKHYRQQGMGIYEAGNHAWVDLIRYGTRSQVTDMWKAWPLNFFVPWRFGTFVSLVKQARNHPVRTAMLIGAVDYMREARYRQTGRWFHLPWDYVTAPIAQIIQSKDKTELARNIGSQAALTALFGPGGAFAASQIDDMMKLAQGKSDPYEYERLAKMFWGLGQLYDVTLSDKHGGVSGVLGSLLLGEHNALSYEPRRLMRGLPETLPGLRKSELVQEAESMQQSREEKRLRREERRKERPRNTIEDRLRAAGYLR